MNSFDFVTLLQTDDACNKEVTRKPSGEIDSHSVAAIANAIATTVHVPSVQSFADLLRETASKTNRVLILGWISGTEPEQGEARGESYTLLSRKRLQARLVADGQTGDAEGLVLIGGLEYAARLKVNFQQSSWML